MLKENGELEMSTVSEVTNPVRAPKMAREFPHQFARRSFFVKAKEPKAPTIHKMSAKKNAPDEDHALNIMIGDFSLRTRTRVFKKLK